jgi:hypothetical protein
VSLGPCLEHEYLTHRVSGLPDRHLAWENIKVFPRLAVIPELQKKTSFKNKHHFKNSTIEISIAFELTAFCPPKKHFNSVFSVPPP